MTTKNVSQNLEKEVGKANKRNQQQGQATKDVTFKFRCSEKELARLKENAQRAHMTVSEYIRRTAIARG